MNPRWLIGLGVVVGTGFLNKYSIVFLVVAMLAAVLLSSHRRRLISIHVLVAVGIAALIVVAYTVAWFKGQPWRPKARPS